MKSNVLIAILIIIMASGFFLHIADNECWFEDNPQPGETWVSDDDNPFVEVRYVKVEDVENGYVLFNRGINDYDSESLKLFKKNYNFYRGTK